MWMVGLGNTAMAWLVDDVAVDDLAIKTPARQQGISVVSPMRAH
jgi:hypothetical protein